LVAEEAIVAKLDPALEFGGRAILVGCESDLITITGEEKHRIAQYVGQVLSKEHYGLARKAFDRDFRRTLVRDINALLPRAEVTDVLIFGVYSKEFKVE
jgi:hypothetical protein